MSHYCLMCGTALQVELEDQRERETCPACGWVYYPHWKVSAGVAVEVNGKALLARRAFDPWKDMWYFPAGFVEADELPEAAAVREAREETGLEVRIGGLVGVFPYDDPRGNGLFFLYRGEAVGGELTCTEEIRELGYFAPDALPLPICSAHAEAVAAWARGARA